MPACISSFSECHIIFPSAATNQPMAKKTVKKEMWSFDWTLKRGEKKENSNEQFFLKRMSISMSIKMNVKKTTTF